MESIYLLFLFVLALLAILDLMVGVSNDAVNFLNSAIGSRAGSRRIIMAISAAGIFIGASFSNGMMEVARTGIFNPQHFYFTEVMVIFIAVMITDVVLLDVFNSMGLPTSTTVSIVFDLLGASVAMALIKSYSNPGFPVSEYINSANILAIVSAILLSVVISFIFGYVIQYITRLIFSFNFEQKIKRYGALWGSLAITCISYFLVLKGLKGTSFMSAEIMEMIENNTGNVLLISIAFWFIILQLINSFTRIDILNIVVLTGTFSLAMAFAGNDLVNFIGVPLAGLESVKLLMNTPGATPDTLLMDGLTASISTNSIFLILAGAIMVITLYTSKKAKLVSHTELDLSRQSEGDERWGSSLVARVIVRRALSISTTINKWIPTPAKKTIDKQFDTAAFNEKQRRMGAEAPLFDKLRATVNLAVASMLIAAGTSLKLPLSTTYVTFMVAMSTSLADRAWGRESAVYRITGVISVIGGWFVTALAAFTISFVIASIIYFGGVTAIVILLSLSLLMLYRTFRRANKKLAQMETTKADKAAADSSLKAGSSIIDIYKAEITDLVSNVVKLFGQSAENFIGEDRKSLRDSVSQIDELSLKVKKLKNNIYPTVKKLQDDDIESGMYYIQVVDYLREIVVSLSFIARPMYEHLDNNHKPFAPEQSDEINSLILKLNNLTALALDIVHNNRFELIDDSSDLKNEILLSLQQSRKQQLKRIKKENASTKVSLLYLNILHEAQSLILNIHNLAKAHRDMMTPAED